MSTKFHWMLAGVLLAATTVGGMTGWVNAAVVAAFTGIAILIVLTSRNENQTVWAVAAGIGIAAALTVLALYRWQESVCTATNASGQRVIIGTQLTERGRRYRETHPGADNDRMLAGLGGLPVNLAWTPASIQRCASVLGVTGTLWMPLFGVAAVFATAVAAGTARSGPPRTTSAKTAHRVFLSYNHEDSAAALKLREFLGGHGIQVTIDSDSMTPGQRISDFIEQSIRQSDTVISLVSTRSLLSSWVALETIHSLSRNRWNDNTLFIACYLDEDFFRPEFRLECTSRIDAQIGRIEQLIPEYASKKIDTVDLNDERTRLYELRNNLGTILARLRDSLCLDVRGEKLSTSGPRLLAAIQKSAAETESRL